MSVTPIAHRTRLRITRSDADCDAASLHNDDAEGSSGPGSSLPSPPLDPRPSTFAESMDALERSLSRRSPTQVFSSPEAHISTPSSPDSFADPPYLPPPDCANSDDSDLSTSCSDDEASLPRSDVPTTRILATSLPSPDVSSSRAVPAGPASDSDIPIPPPTATLDPFRSVPSSPRPEPAVQRSLSLVGSPHRRTFPFTKTKPVRGPPPAPPFTSLTLVKKKLNYFLLNNPTRATFGTSSSPPLSTHMKTYAAAAATLPNATSSASGSSTSPVRQRPASPGKTHPAVLPVTQASPSPVPPAPFICAEDPSTSSQDLFRAPPARRPNTALPSSTRDRGAPTRPRRPTPPPLGDREDDPTAISQAPSRVHSTLHLSFPILPSLMCTEAGCHCAPFHAANWTASKQSLIRHLSTNHGITIKRTEKWCLLCLRRTPSRVSDHVCFKSQPHVAALNSELRFKCSSCPFSANTKRGLTNHQASHKRNCATPNIVLPQKNMNRNRRPRELLTAAQSRAREDPTWRAIHDPPTDNVVPTINRFLPLADLPTEDQPSPVPPRHSPSIHRPAHWTRPTGDDSQVPSPPSSLVHPQSSSPPTTQLSASPSVPASADAGLADDALPPSLTPPPSAGTEDDDPLQDFNDILREINDHRHEDDAWGVFESVVAEITEAIGVIVNLPPKKDQETAFTPQHIDAGNCRVIQRLYKRNRRRAIRLIVEGDSQRCHIPSSTVADHFKSAFAERDFDGSVLEGAYPSNHPECDSSPFSPAEVRARLHRFENSAPGPDRISYSHLKTADPECRILSKIFNFCLHFRKIPSSWKVSKTILIHKKDDFDDIKNWRPISLCNTLYKLYTGCLASRLVNWLSDFEVLSFTQKGFLPFDGVFEHRFVVNQAQTLAELERSDLCMAQIDLSNAFGSIPHRAIFSALLEAGAGLHFTEVIKDLYMESSTEIFAGDGITDELLISAGVRQGCPISGILFNLVLDPVLRRLQQNRSDHHVLAFADDITLLESSPEKLQEQLDLLYQLLSSLSLAVNPAKCASFHLSGSTPVGTRDSSFSINGSPIPALKDGEESSFLGTPVGFHLAVPLHSIRDFMLLGEMIAKSKLAPWQRIDALKTFFFPAFVFKMRTEQLSKGDMKIVDDFIRPLIKDTLYLDDSAANDYIYGSTNFGLLGVPKLAEEVDVLMVDNCFKLLTSKDPTIRDLAWGDLLLHATSRTGLDPSADLVEKFLNGVQHEEGFHHTSSPYASTWSHARSASTRLGIKWRCREVLDIELHLDEKVLGPSDRTKVCRSIKEALRVSWAKDLIDKPSQGAAIEVTSLHRASSHFIRNGDYTKFADWRFIHKARLGLLRLNGNTPWDTSMRQCRRCPAQNESTLHVISLCKPNMKLRTDRHNAIVDRVLKAKRRDWQIHSLNQVVGDEGLRPDIILKKGNSEAIVLDVTVPFENRCQAFSNARDEKRRKYSSIATLLSRDFKKVTVDALVVGALGAWDPLNDTVIRRFTNKKYATKFRKLCVSDAISHTRKIFQKHVLGHIPPEQRLRARTAAILQVPPNELPDFDADDASYQDNANQPAGL